MQDDHLVFSMIKGVKNSLSLDLYLSTGAHLWYGV